MNKLLLPRIKKNSTHAKALTISIVFHFHERSIHLKTNQAI